MKARPISGRRILHIVPFLWSGAGSVITRLCLSQAEQNDVAIVTTGRAKGMEDWPEYRRRLRGGGVRHFEINFFERDSALFWNGVSILTGVIERLRPDVVHCHSGVPACAVAAARDCAGSSFKFVSHLHSWGLNRPEWMNRMDLWGFRQSDQVLCSSRTYERILLDAGVPKRKVSYLPWGLPLTEIRKAARAASSSKPGRTVGFLGRIEPRKGQMELVSAFERYHRRYPDSTLALIGPVADVGYARQLSAHVRRSGLSNAIAISGKVRNPYREMRNWDLFVSMSKDEGQGLAVLEAMSLQVPVIALNVAGIQDYLRSGINGISLNDGSPTAVAACIEVLLEDRKLAERLARGGVRTVEKHFDWDQNVKRLHHIYGAA